MRKACLAPPPLECLLPRFAWTLKGPAHRPTALRKNRGDNFAS